MAEKPVRFNWHGVTFWSCLGVAILYMGLSTLRKDSKIPTIFDAEGQRIMKTYLRYNYPEFADWIGIDRRRAVSLGESASFRTRR